MRKGARLPALAAVAVLLAAGTSCSTAEPAPVVEGATPSSSPNQTDDVQNGGETPDDGTSSATASESAPPEDPAALPNLEVTGEPATGLDVPWSLVALPDGSLLVSERETGEIKRVVEGAVTTIGVIEDAVAAAGEGGLLGMAIGPDFETDQQLFAYYTSPSDNRIVSMDYSPAELGEPQEVLTGIPKADIHNGGRIKFGPDGYLYVGTGDAAQAPNAQDQENLGGKILRITADGDPAPGNPFGDSPVFSLGHRNVQGLAWDSEERLWASEFGPEVDDELNLITPGENYGWPEVTGAPGRDGFVDAQVVWPSTAASSPSGMAILNDVAYIGGLRGERLWQVPLGSGSAGMPVSHFGGENGRLRDVVEGPDGHIWIATNESPGARVLRVEAT